MKLLILFFALFALVSAQQHVDTTVINVAEEIDQTSEHFLISIDHIEDIVSSDSNTVIAERDIRVALRFDVGKDSFSINGAQVEIGYSELTVSAQVIEVLPEGAQRPFDDLISVQLRVFAGFRQVQFEDGTLVDGIFMQERVVAVQSTELWQAEVVEQVFIVRKDGTIARQEVAKVAVLQGEPQPNPKEEEEEGEKETPENHPAPAHPDHEPGSFDHAKDKAEDEIKQACRKVKSFFHKVARWFHGLPFYQRVLVSFAGGIVLSIIAILFFKCLARCCCCFRKKKSCTGCKGCPANSNNYKDNIRVYSLQYTSVPQDEKDAKKEADIQMV